ncbi:MAG: glycosyltransferase family 4 protein [Planctomycetota bacterium]
MLRIVHATTFLHPDRYGGAERVVHGLARAQAEAGHDVTVVTGNHDGRAAREDRDGFRLERFPMPRGARGLQFFRAAARGCSALLQELRTPGFDILHTHQVATAGPALSEKGLARSKIHSFYAPYSEEFAAERGRSGPLGLIPRLKSVALKRLDRRCVLLADRTVVLSETSRRQLSRLAGSARIRLAKVRPGVDLQRFFPADRKETGRTPTILTVRRLVRRMGLDVAISAVARLKNAGRDLKFQIAGEGPERTRLQRLIRELGLRDRVTLLGPVADEALPDLYRAADLFLLPTRDLEGFGMATLEALACGLPVLGTDVGATLELISDLTPGVPLVPCEPVGMASGLAAALERLFELAGRARQAAGRIAETCSWQASSARMEQVYLEALAESGR